MRSTSLRRAALVLAVLASLAACDRGATPSQADATPVVTEAATAPIATKPA